MFDVGNSIKKYVDPKCQRYDRHIALIFPAILFFGMALSSSYCWGQRSPSNSQQIDPIRVGDDVEVKVLDEWFLGTVLDYEDEIAEVEYSDDGRKRTRKFSPKSIRFPNGEGHWIVWKDRKGDLEAEARYITRDENEVVIRKADGKELTLRIDDLSLQLKQMVRRTPLPGEENHIEGVAPFRIGDEVQVQQHRNWYDGTIRKLAVGEAEVQYDDDGRSRSRSFEFDEIRFPGGEGHWRSWSDTSGKFKVVARFLSRSETHVRLLKENGQEIEVPIGRLSAKLRRLARKTPVKGKELTVDGIAPIRVGDQVVVKESSDEWLPGIVIEVQPKAAMVEYVRNEKTYKKDFEFGDISFPNGESEWMKWQSEDGQFEVVARFLRKTPGHAVLIKENGSEIRVPIEKLSARFQQKINTSLVTVRLPNLVTLQASGVVAGSFGELPNFSGLALPAAELIPLLKPEDLPADGGFGFPLPQGNRISMVQPIGGNWLAVGTYLNSFRQKGVSRLHWVDPVAKKKLNGPALVGEQRVLGYSAAHSRLLTGVYENSRDSVPTALCTYRLDSKSEFAEPEIRWEVKGSTYSGGFKVAMLNNGRVIFQRSRELFLIDVGAAKIDYKLDGVSGDFVLHPSENYFVCGSSSAGTAMYRVASGSMVARQAKSRLYAKYGFSADGLNLLTLDTAKLVVSRIDKDAAAQSYATANFASQNRLPSGLPQMIDERWVMTSSAPFELYDTVKQVKVWEYVANGMTIQHPMLIGNRLLVAGVKSTGGYRKQATTFFLGMATVPHSVVVKLAEQADPKSMIVLAAGMGVRIEAGSQEVKSQLLQIVQRCGWHEDPASRVTLSGTAAQQPVETITYEETKVGFGGWSGRGTPTGKTFSKQFRPWKQILELKIGDANLWQTQRTAGAPSGGKVEELDKMLRAAEQPSYSVFESLNLKDWVFIDPKYRRGVGYSSIGPAGFSDKKLDEKGDYVGVSSDD